ncbi:MAG: low molecular weight phosphotyrosine protein phosphatase [Bdellovibrionales bacterium]|nr:low molecular weight phosphotyrosine protein phosphatase [Bdellovibrionales bacterium]
MRKKVLFVCLGNICRSPAAEGVMKHLLHQAQLEDHVFVDSCGTSAHHEGEEADPRMQKHAEDRGYKITSIARGFRKADFEEFDYIITMDESNYNNLVSLDRKGHFREKIAKMTDFCESIEAPSVPDPYYGGPDGFEEVLDILEDACDGFLKKIKKEL